MLRIGLLLDSLTVHRWIFRILEKIYRSDFAEVVLLVTKQSLFRPRSSFFGCVIADRRHLARSLYVRADKYLFADFLGRKGIPIEDRFDEVEAAGLLNGVPVIKGPGPVDTTSIYNRDPLRECRTTSSGDSSASGAGRRYGLR